MNYSFQYIRIEFKRAVHAFLSGAVTLIIISAITVGSAAALYTLLQSLGVSEPVKIAMSIRGDDSMSVVLLRLVQGMDSVSAVCRFELTDEDEAREGVLDGTYASAIILPENFYDEVNTGINPPALILVPSKMPDGVKGFSELLSSAASLVDTVEGGIYAVTDAGSVYGMSVSRQDMEAYLTSIAYDALLGRTKFFEESFETSLDVDDLISYYTVSACLIILLVSCTGFVYLYSRRTRAVEFALRRNGLGPVRTGFVRFLVMMMQLVLITVLFVLVIRTASFFLEKREEEMLYLAASSLKDACGILISPANVLPVLFSICGFTHLIYCLLKGREDSGLILLIVFMIMLIIGGCVVPSVFLPDAAVRIGEHLPAFLWRDDIFSGGIIRELIMGILFFAGGEVLSWVRS
ncbi:MAG: ABC transporter permease [Lachnospiraceae bacterium]|nr:ABC transporter permease [Lachnospiraceae bacterium]